VRYGHRIAAAYQRQLSMVCGPISSGPWTVKENIIRFKKAIYLLSIRKNKQSLMFDQMPFEDVFQKYHEWVKKQGRSSGKILTHFYDKIFTSKLINKMYFLFGWNLSDGASYERNRGVELNFSLNDLEENFVQNTNNTNNIKLIQVSDDENSDSESETSDNNSESDDSIEILDDEEDSVKEMDDESIKEEIQNQRRVLQNANVELYLSMDKLIGTSASYMYSVKKSFVMLKTDSINNAEIRQKNENKINSINNILSNLNADNWADIKVALRDKIGDLE
jgi:hypothetical protein